MARVKVKRFHITAIYDDGSIGSVMSPEDLREALGIRYGFVKYEPEPHAKPVGFASCRLPDHIKLENGGQACDVRYGSCSCGATHSASQYIERLEALLAAPRFEWIPMATRAPDPNPKRLVLVATEYGAHALRFSDYPGKAIYWAELPEAP